MKLKLKKKTPECAGCGEPLKGKRLPTAELRLQSETDTEVVTLVICKQCTSLVDMSADILEKL